MEKELKPSNKVNNRTDTGCVIFRPGQLKAVPLDNVYEVSAYRTRLRTDQLSASGACVSKQYVKLNKAKRKSADFVSQCGGCDSIVCIHRIE